MQQIGLIGVGYIGKLLLDGLREEGYPVTAYDIDERKIEYGRDKGASAAKHPEAVGRKSDVVLIAVPGTAAVEETMQGEDGLLSGLTGEELVIDVTTTLPETSIVCEELCSERGIDFIEAPITGGAPREGYHMMVGGTENRYRKAKPILDVICNDHARVGPIPQGTIFKLGLQMRYAGHNAIDAEVIEFVRDNNIDPRLFNDFLDFDIWEKYFRGDFTQDVEGLGGLRIWHKDIGYAQRFAHERNTALPVTSVVHEAYKATLRQVAEDEGHAAGVIKYWQTLNDTAKRDNKEKK